jgi:inosine-uridine nucleoside N-ribohydrolase
MRCGLSVLGRVLAGVAATACGAGAPAAGPQRIVLEADPISDYDDPVAVLIAATAPEFDLLGVVIGGADIATSAAAARRLLRIAGREEVGVYAGVESTAERPPFDYFSQYPRRRWGRYPQLDKLAAGQPLDVEPPDGVGFYLDAVAAHPGEVTIIVAGPLTTLAEAMRRADRDGTGDEFRRSIRQVLFSGGDFDTAEWNVYEDVPSARLVFGSGVPLYQFGGEGEGKPYLKHGDRRRLWESRTPISWTLLEVYRLYDGGWDPTAPFTPILYDVHPLAFLIEGQRFSEFKPMAVEVGPEGRLVRVDGPPNVQSRVRNRGGLLVAWSLDRLTDPKPAAANHLRAIGRLAAAMSPRPEGLVAALDAAIAAVRSGDAAGPALEVRLAAVGEQLGSLGPQREAADRHLDLARRFLLGERTGVAWSDPHTGWNIALFRLRAVVSKRQVAAAAAAAALLAAAAYGLHRWRRAVRR